MVGRHPRVPVKQGLGTHKHDEVNRGSQKIALVHARPATSRKCTSMPRQSHPRARTARANSTQVPHRQSGAMRQMRTRTYHSGFSTGHESPSPSLCPNDSTPYKIHFGRLLRLSTSRYIGPAAVRRRARRQQIQVRSDGAKTPPRDGDSARLARWLARVQRPDCSSQRSLNDQTLPCTGNTTVI